MTADLTYTPVGATRLAELVWGDTPLAFRRFERTIRIGQGQADWEAATAAVMQWAVKTRSGFAVQPADEGDRAAGQGRDYTLIAALGPLTLREPVRVVAVVAAPDRHGFAYGTRSGHPVRGEEAFIVHRSADGVVWLTLRSLTGSGPGMWRLVFPAALVAQHWYRRRYSRALVPTR